jgi:peptidoglycan-associated lipoprotein
MKRTALFMVCVAALALFFAGCSIIRPTPPAPKPVAPADGSRVSTIAPTLTVEAVKGAEQYQWTVESAADSIIAQGTSLEPSWTVTRGLLANQQSYQWTCKARNSHGWGKEFDPEWTFATDVPLPGAPEPVAPPDGPELATLTPILRVRDIPEVDEYQWVIKDTTTKEVARGTSPEPSWSVPGATLANLTKYTWTCQARNAAGWGSSFTPEWAFRVKLPPPPPPVAPPLATIHFDFDKYDIRPGDAKILEGDAAYLRTNAGLKLILEGYCDPIGTEEYNRGLGLRRSNAAKAYLVKLDIDGSRLSVISYGKEKLVTTDESQFELNRRVEFKPKD